MKARIHKNSLLKCRQCSQHSCAGCQMPYSYNYSTASDTSRYCSSKCEAGKYPKDLIRARSWA